MSDKPTHLPDIDPLETLEWLTALDAVLEHDGPVRARFLLDRLLDRARQTPGAAASWFRTPYVNNLDPADAVEVPGDPALEKRIRAILRWNAVVMVHLANQARPGAGGHMSTYQSISTLFETGFNHFWHAPSGPHDGDLVFFQGHASPGIYARALLEGRLTEEQVAAFRQEASGEGLSSYPHPWLMDDFWQFATVSMGLGPLIAIYQARLMKVLHQRGLLDVGGRKVWAFLGDGETDEPESLSGLGFAAREGLDNLIFVVNCNLQRLDGPVRGNGKIVQDLEADFRAAGWNVLKVLWSSEWDEIFARDHHGLLRQRLEGMVDGELQNLFHHSLAKQDPAYLREHLFGPAPELRELVADLSDEALGRLRPGGHDPAKVYDAYSKAVAHTGQPTVIFAQTVKGYGLGAAGEALNTAHNTKTLKPEELAAFYQRLGLPGEASDPPTFIQPGEDSPEARYLRTRREALGGPFPQRRSAFEALPVPSLETFKPLLDGSGKREISTTQAFVRALTLLLRDAELAPHLVPIIADEARTFGMEGMFRQLGIYAPEGQLYKPVDADQLMFYKEEQTGQILQEGINEAGAVASWIAAATSYSNHGLPLVPFYIFYSMFGFQRIGDFVWAAADMQARGFLVGGTAGRTTLNGEGLQHQDGHSLLAAATIPNCVSYDPTFGYEMAVILRDGIRRMYQEDERVLYYVTAMNENYTHPPMPDGAEEGILAGMYLLQESKSRSKKKPRVQLLGSGTILREVLAAVNMLGEYGVEADVWSVTSFNELRRDALRVERRNLHHPGEEAETCYLERCLAGRPGPVIAATDYMKTYADQVRAWVPGTYRVLGTDGFGRSDTREALRRFFEVDRAYVTLAALTALADDGALDRKTVTEAIEKLGLDSAKPDPTTV